VKLMQVKKKIIKFETVYNSFIIKPIRCTNFTNLFWNETLHVSDSCEISASGGFIIKKYVTMHGLMNTKFVLNSWDIKTLLLLNSKHCPFFESFVFSLLSEYVFPLKPHNWVVYNPVCCLKYGNQQRGH
jgi:hypothetical protein